MLNYQVFSGVILNLSLLMMLAFLYTVTPVNFVGKQMIKRGAIGILIGCVGIGIMLSPMQLIPGVVFDTRSILISVAGLFFGGIPTVIAAFMMSLFRLSQGGSGAITGVLVLICSGSLGFWAHQHRLKALIDGKQRRFWELYGLGIFVHLGMLGCMLTLPNNLAMSVLTQITLPVMVIYPIGTVLLGLMFFNQMDQRLLGEKMKLYMSHAPFGIFLFDATGNYRDVNEVAVKTTGYSREELLQKNISDLAVPESIEKGLDGFQKRFSEGKRLQDIRYVKKNGEIRHWDITVVRIDQQHFLGFTMDTTVQRQNELDLIAAKVAAEVASVAKDHFLANMSHEIRTPMNGFMGMIQLLKMTQLSKEQQEYLHLSESSSDALLAVVNEIMDYSKIQAGGMVVENQAFDLKALLKEMTALFSATARLKEIQLTYRMAPDVPDRLMGDAFKLKQVLSNLVGNAIKFTAVGSVEISVRRTDVMKGEVAQLEFSVRDTGIGIQEDKRDMLFNRFVQVDGSHTREYGGTGLGLAISKGLVELMGGNIWIEGNGESGSVFLFTCSLKMNAYVDTSESAVSQEKQVKRHTPSMRILLAEDDPISRQLIESIARRLGWEIVSAENGERAVDLFRTGIYDSVLMDCQMPVMDGYEATRLIRHLEGDSNHTQIIALTAHALHGDEAKCIEAGMDAYMTKPIDIQGLITLLTDQGNSLANARARLSH